MKIIVEYLPYVFMFGWTVFSIIYIIKARISPENINIHILESIPQIFATIGILGTFMGIAYGLSSFDVKKIEDSIPQLLDGLKTAFYASIAGIILLIISSKFIEFSQKKYDKIVMSDEAIALNKVIELLTDLKEDLSRNIVDTEELSQKLQSAGVFNEVKLEIKELNNSLNTMANELSNIIAAGFERLSGQQEQERRSTIPYLEKLQKDIADLSDRIKDPSTELAEKIVKDVETALENIVKEFKSSLAGSAKEEMESLATFLRQTGGALSDFPEKIQDMTNTLNSNIKGLQDVVKQSSMQTVSASTESSASTRQLLEEMNTILKYFYTIYS